MHQIWDHRGEGDVETQPHALVLGAGTGPTTTGVWAHAACAQLLVRPGPNPGRIPALVHQEKCTGSVMATLRYIAEKKRGGEHWELSKGPSGRQWKGKL